MESGEEEEPARKKTENYINWRYQKCDTKRDV
jgi:hypothetical protein